MEVKHWAKERNFTRIIKKLLVGLFAVGFSLAHADVTPPPGEYECFSNSSHNFGQKAGIEISSLGGTGYEIKWTANLSSNRYMLNKYVSEDTAMINSRTCEGELVSNVYFIRNGQQSDLPIARAKGGYIIVNFNEDRNNPGLGLTFQTPTIRMIGGEYCWASYKYRNDGHYSAYTCKPKMAFGYAGCADGSCN